MRRSSAQITNYPREELVGRLVVGVVNFPPRQIGPVRSEVLVLGTYSAEGVLLLSPEPGAAAGRPGRLSRALRGRRRRASRSAGGGVMSSIGADG